MLRLAVAKMRWIFACPIGWRIAPGHPKRMALEFLEVLEP